MFKKLFLAPGRLLIGIFSGGRRRNYRSTRSRPSVGFGTIILSLFCWLVIAGGVLYAVDKTGLLKQALDVGVDVTGVNDDVVVGDPSPLEKNGDETAQDDNSPNATGSLVSGGGDAPTTPPVGQNTSGGGGSAVAENQQPAEVAEMWLVILHSIPKSARDEADRLRKQYQTKGLEVDVLDSDAFPRLKRGLWLVAIGPFDDKLSATMAANKATKFNAQLMVRKGL